MFFRILFAKYLQETDRTEKACPTNEKEITSVCQSPAICPSGSRRHMIRLLIRGNANQHMSDQEIKDIIEYLKWIDENAGM